MQRAPRGRLCLSALQKRDEEIHGTKFNINLRARSRIEEIDCLTPARLAPAEQDADVLVWNHTRIS